MNELRVVDLNAPNTAWERRVQDDIADTLSRWMADAKAGKFDAIAICGVRKDGSVDHTVPAHDQHPALVGAVVTMTHWMIDYATPTLEP